MEFYALLFLLLLSAKNNLTDNLPASKSPSIGVIPLQILKLTIPWLSSHSSFLAMYRLIQHLISLFGLSIKTTSSSTRLTSLTSVPCKVMKFVSHSSERCENKRKTTQFWDSKHNIGVQSEMRCRHKTGLLHKHRTIHLLFWG